MGHRRHTACITIETNGGAQVVLRPSLVQYSVASRHDLFLTRSTLLGAYASCKDL